MKMSINGTNYEVNEPINYETYYRVEMVYGSGSFPDKYETYEDAYAAMCRNFVKEENKGYKPTLYKIVKYMNSKYINKRKEVWK